MSSSLRKSKIKEKLEKKKNMKPRKKHTHTFNREDGQCVSAAVRTQRVAAQPQSSHSRGQDEQGL
jgi:hypothetical protein